MPLLIALLFMLFASLAGCGGGTQAPAKVPARAQAAPKPNAAPAPSESAPAPDPAPDPAAAPSAAALPSNPPLPDATWASTPAQPPAPQSPPAPEAAATTTSSSSELPDRLDAGQIHRGALVAVLAGGVGQFLRRLRAEPKLDKGRFMGWRLVSFAQGDATLRSGVLQPGDTVLRVNGQSIERPEQFKDVWDSMATASDLVLQVQRAGKNSELRYHIID